MKFFVTFALCVLACASPISCGISEEVEGIIISIRDAMPKGFPELGIPSLAPFHLSHANFNLKLPTWNAKGNVSNMVVDGLNVFDIKKVKVGVFSKKVNIELNFHQINITTDYILDNAWVKKDNITTEFSGKGQAFFIVSNIDVSIVAKAKVSLFTGKAKLKKLNIVPTIGDIESDIQGVSDDINRMLSNDGADLINSYQDKISSIISNIALKKINEVLANVNIYELMAEDVSFLNEIAEVSED